MCTEAMYEEMMRQRYGEWAEFFMDSSLKFDKPAIDQTELQNFTPAVWLEAA